MNSSNRESSFIYDSTEKLVGSSVDRYLSTKERQLSPAGKMGFKLKDIQMAPVTPDLSFDYADRQGSDDQYLNELGYSDPEFNIVNDQHDFETEFPHEQSEIDNDFNDDSSQPISDIQPDESLQALRKPEELMPGLVKINTVLTEKGYLPLKLMSDDVNATSKTVSIDSVNKWVDCLSCCILEMGQRLDQQQRAVQSVSQSVRTGKQSYNSILDQNEALEEKLKIALKKISLAEMQKSLLVDEKSSRSKTRKSEEGDEKRLIKGYDQQLQESERRVRQRETELDRFKLKMEAIVVKERAVAARHRTALAAWRSGAVLSLGGPGTGSVTGTGGHNSPKAGAGANSPFGRSSMSAHCSPNSKMPASPAPFRRMSDSPASAVRPRRESLSASTTSRQQSMGDEASAWDVIEALDDQRHALERANEELVEQLADMNRSLVSECSHRGSTIGLSRSNLFGSADQSEHGAGAGGGGGSNPLTPLRCDQSFASPTRTQPTATATKMYEHITEQQQKIEQLELKIEKARVKCEDADKSSMQLRAKMQELKEEADSLRSELSSRPSAKQWMQKQSELAESESKLRDLIVMRREKAELQGERKHMSVKQRVLMDKSNFELELWALDSLPQEVTRDALKAVCRELGLSDISDIQPAIMKLKAVVGAVPRMEKFITKICIFLFQNENERERRRRGGIQTEEGGRQGQGQGQNGDHDHDPVPPQLSMEHVMPLLQRWSVDLQALDSMESFSDRAS